MNKKVPLLVAMLFAIGTIQVADVHAAEVIESTSLLGSGMQNTLVISRISTT